MRFLVVFEYRGERIEVQIDAVSYGAALKGAWTNPKWVAKEIVEISPQ